MHFAGGVHHIRVHARTSTRVVFIILGLIHRLRLVVVLTIRIQRLFSAMMLTSDSYCQWCLTYEDLKTDTANFVLYVMVRKLI